MERLFQIQRLYSWLIDAVSIYIYICLGSTRFFFQMWIGNGRETPLGSMVLAEIQGTGELLYDIYSVRQ